MKLIYNFGILLGCLISCKPSPQQHTANEKQAMPEQSKPFVTEKPQAQTSNQSLKKSKYHLVILHDQSIGFGYDIYEGNQVKIHQPHIPVVEGLQGFKTAEDAQKVAEKVIEKMDQGIIPPTLSKDEMLILGVL